LPRKHDQSRKLQQRAERVLPGGVNSPVRAFKAVGGDPPFIVKGSGARVWDADGNQYLDYLGSWGPLILGHAHPEVVAAIEDAARRGSSFGASTPAEVDLAEAVLEAFPAATGRKYIVKFEGCYHGHGDSLLVKAGSGVATLGIPGSAGVPEEFAKLTLALPFNDPKAVEKAFREFRGEIACVIVEPVVGNMGCVPPAPGYLDALRYLTSREGALLIFDEVITGFRVAFGGAQELYGTRPDLTTLGKIIGGGLPVGAYAGPRELMERVAPAGDVYQAGTLSGNPLAMAAGVAQLLHLRESRPYDTLETRALRLVRGVGERARELEVPFHGGAAGAMFGWHFVDGPVRSFTDAEQGDDDFFTRFFHAALRRGVFLPPSPFEAGFLSTAHEDADVDAITDRLREALTEAAG